MDAKSYHRWAAKVYGICFYNRWLWLCGYTNTASIKNQDDVYKYDPGNNTWTEVMNYGGQGRRGTIGFSIGNYGYVGTGAGVSYCKDFWQFDPDAICGWAKVANFPTVERDGAIAFSIGNYGYVGTGFQLSALANEQDFWQYDPLNNVWTQEANVPGKRALAVGFSIGNYGYVGTGQDQYTNALNDFWQYNPKTNKWIQKANYAGGLRYSAVAFTIDSLGYVGTGSDGNTLYKDFWAYNPNTNTWTQMANFGGAARHSAAGFAVGTYGYIGTGGGTYPTVYKDFWQYSQGSNTWTQMADYAGNGRLAIVGVTLGKNGYFVTSGVSGYYADLNPYDECWMFDALNNTWIPKCPMNLAETHSYSVSFTIDHCAYVGTGYYNDF